MSVAVAASSTRPYTLGVEPPGEYLDALDEAHRGRLRAGARV